MADGYAPFSDYQRGVLDGIRQALKALDGHGFQDTAHDRVRRLLACDECSHAPEKHPDGAECLERVMPPRPGLLAACHCAEYEPRAFLRTTASAERHV